MLEFDARLLMRAPDDDDSAGAAALLTEYVRPLEMLMVVCRPDSKFAIIRVCGRGGKSRGRKEARRASDDGSVGVGEGRGWQEWRRGKRRDEGGEARGGEGVRGDAEGRRGEARGREVSEG